MAWLGMLCCLFPFSSKAQQQQEDGGLAQQRNVAVVYDNSSSMQEAGRWWYANYAMQTLTGLLSPDDRLYQVRMSNRDQAEQLSLEDQARSINQIRSQREPDADTPYQAVQTAMDALGRHKGQDNWLLVISDGKFGGISSDQREALRKQVQRFTKQTGARAAFLLIGEDQAEVDDLARGAAVQVWKQAAQANIYKALDRRDIIRQMRRVAADITSQTVGAGPDVRADSNVVRVTSEFPLTRLSLLEQRRENPGRIADLTSAASGSASLEIASVLDVAMPPPSEVSLFGQITHVRGGAGDRIIPAGQIELTFDRPVDANRVAVLPEVAARLSTSLIEASGQPLPGANGVYQPCAGDTLRVRATLVTPSGDTLLQRVQRPEAVDVQMRHAQQQVVLSPNAANTFFQEQLVVPLDTTTISLSATYPGYFNFKSRLFTLQARQCRPARALELLPMEPWTAKVTELDEREPRPVVPLADSQRIASGEFGDWRLEVVDDGGLDLLVRRDTGAGRWTVRPKRAWGPPLFTPKGEFQVVIEAVSPRRSETAVRDTVQFTIRGVSWWRSWGTWLLSLILFLLLAIYIWLVKKKDRFCRGSWVVWQETDKMRNRSHSKRRKKLPGSWAERWLNCWTPEERTVKGVLFRASSGCGQVIVPAETQSDDMKIGGVSLTDPGRQDEHLDAGDSLQTEDRSSKYVFTYQAS